MKALLRLKPYLRPHWGPLLLSLLLAIPLSALRISPAPLIKYMTDDLLIHKDASKLVVYPLITIGLYVINFVVRFLHYYLNRLVIARVNLALKTDLFNHLLGLSADYFTSQRTGTLISRVGSDPVLVHGGINSLNDLIREPITFMALLGYALYLNWRLAILTLLILPPLIWVFSASGRNIKRYIKRLAEADAEAFATLQESFSGIRVVKLFGLEAYVKRIFRTSTDRYTRYYLKTSVLEEAAHPLVELLLFSLVAAMIYMGGAQILEGRMTSGDLFAFFATFALIINPVRNLNNVNIKLNQAAGACERIFQVFDLKSHIQEVDQPKSIHGLKTGIELRGVSFAYPDAPERMILKNVSFAIPRGKTIALVGASGAGKSSLASLLPRIFDVTLGQIAWDGVDIRELRVPELRNAIAVVSQDVFLFNDTVRENIRCGRLDASDAEILEAARRAHAMDFIERLPDGITTRIGDRGQKLSGGEKQRLSIARAFLRQSPVLLLDEATSSLDTASERAVQEALNELMKNRTTLIIAHRLSTIQNADEILVLKDGVIVERGKHDQLIRTGGEYSHFYQMGRTSLETNA